MLKYLFSVKFTDGTTYTQNADDRSLIEPEIRSCFYDVMQAIEKGKKIEYFVLSDGKDSYLVDLIDGHFEVNGKGFFMHNRRDLTDFRIIFYRQHTRIVFYRQQTHAVDIDEQEHEITYCLGWQTTEDGKNTQRIMEIY